MDGYNRTRSKHIRERERVMGYNSTTRIYTLLQIENSVLKNGNVGEVK